MNIISKKDPAIDVISHDVAQMPVNTDASSYARTGWMICLGGVIGFLLWANFAPLDKGVPLSGTVVKEGNRKAVQYVGGGIVQDILVNDGDHVKEGQVLVRMNNVQVKSALEITMAQYLGARALEARLKAELAGKTNIPFPPELERYKADDRVSGFLALQAQLMTSRQVALQSELASVDESIAGIEAQIHGWELSRDSKKEQLVLLKEQVDSSRDLAKDGFIARNRFLELQRSYVQMSGAIAEDIGNIDRSRRQANELRLKKAQRHQEYQKELRTQLTDTQKEASALVGRLEGQEFDANNVDVKSPADGIVLGSNVFTRGGVVAPGAKMMEIVPADDALVVEGQLAVNLVDKVHPGLPVEIMLSAFNSNKTPHIPAEVVTVAADRSIEERTGSPYYKVRVKVTQEGLKLIASHKLNVVPGMPADLFVKTGERSMMNYLLKPLYDRARTSLSEE